MAVRIRKNGRIFCAAMTEEEPGDTYVDDALHERMSLGWGILVAEPMERHKISGEWWWKGNVPGGVAVEHFERDMEIVDQGAHIKELERSVEKLQGYRREARNLRYLKVIVDEIVGIAATILSPQQGTYDWTLNEVKRLLREAYGATIREHLAQEQSDKDAQRELVYRAFKPAIDIMTQKHLPE